MQQHIQLWSVLWLDNLRSYNLMLCAVITYRNFCFEKFFDIIKKNKGKGVLMP